MTTIAATDTLGRWFLKVKNENTRKYYTVFLNYYCQYTGLSPEEIIKQRREDLRGEDPVIQHRHEELASGFFDYLVKKKKYEPSGASTGQRVVASFYRHNYVPLLERFETYEPETARRIPNQRELKAIIQKTEDLAERAWILVQAQSGLGRGDMLRLNLSMMSPAYGDLKKQLLDRRNTVHLQLHRKKRAGKGRPFDCWFGPEAVQAVLEYFAKIPGLKGGRVFPISERTTYNIAQRGGQKADLDLGTHDFRAYFSTQLELAKVNQNLVDYWMGHSLGMNRGYTAPPIPDQEKAYKEAYETHLKVGL